MQEYYKILNLTQDATDEEIENAYKKLKAQYSRERFLEGEIGNNAAKNLTKLETAYNEIIADRKRHTDSGKSFDFSEVEKLLKAGNISGAQIKLDNYSDRDAEWHYLQAVVFYKKNWTNESKKQLEIAMNMDPQNEKYATAYTKLKEKMEFNDKQFHSGNVHYNQGGQANHDTGRQMGGQSCDCFTFCATWCCMDMLCSMCCN